MTTGRKIAFSLSILLTAIPFVFAQNLHPKENEIKAAFIYNIIVFTTWDESDFRNAGDPLVIGILEHDPFGSFIDELVKGEKAQGHPIVVKRVDRNDTQGVHVLFISERVKVNVENFLAQNNVPLVISDQPGFTKKGGAIRLFTENSKMRFEVNLKTLGSSHVTLSSKLLRLAKICCEE